MTKRARHPQTGAIVLVPDAQFEAFLEKTGYVDDESAEQPDEQESSQAGAQ